MTIRRLNRASTQRVGALATAVIAGLAAFAVAAPTASAHPKAPKFGRDIEVPAPYQGQTLCDPRVKPGVAKFRLMILATYSGTGDSGVTRACSIGGRSEHKEGRAWDWQVSVHNARQVGQVHNLFAWLFANDKYGNRDAMARRLGIMYIIWNKKIWNASSSHWEKYNCSGTTDCHRNHVHFSFGWAGAKARTSFWSGKVSPVIDPPKPLLKDSRLPKNRWVDSRTDEWTRTWYKLSKGHRYQLTVSGTFIYGWDENGPRVADAECSLRSGDSGAWARTLAGTDPSRQLLDLFVFNRSGWIPVHNDGHGCDPHHTYTMTVKMKKTGAMRFSVKEPNHRQDNHGALRVRIHAA